MDYLSCAPATLYRGGGFFEDKALLVRMSEPALTAQANCQLLHEVFPPFSYQRPMPVHLFATEPGFVEQLRSGMEGVNQDREHGAASALVCLDAGFLHSNVLYARSAKGIRIVYETHRANDRPYVPQVDPLSAPYAREPMYDGQGVDLFLGSAGTGNYGHWLVDDLPRAAAVAALRSSSGTRSIRIWISDAGEPMNTVRAASLQLMCRGLGPIDVKVAHLDRVYEFKRLHYVTPVSFHPVMKCPAAIRWVAAPFADQPRGRRLFVSRRPERGRGLLNQADVWQRLAELGFEAVEVEGMSFEEQATTFAQADIVVGCMGAAMTNTLFARRGTPVLYLAPEGWVEPFYWDLAAVCGHGYGVVYGPVNASDVPAHLASFTIDLDRLNSSLEVLLPWTPA